MIAKFLLIFYWLMLGCSIPFTIGVKHAAQINKLNWSNSVLITVVEFKQEICADGECMLMERNFATGTSFIIDHTDEQTIMMSAAHLCMQSKVVESITAEGFENVDASIVKTASMFVDNKNVQYYVDEILFKDEQSDICIYKTKQIVPYLPLRIADEMPEYGEEVWTIGAPTGFMPDTAKPISRGLFSGEAIRTDFFGIQQNIANYSLPTIQGMSGSPIMNSEGYVIGIVSAVHRDWHMISFSPTLAQIRAAIDTVYDD